MSVLSHDVIGKFSSDHVHRPFRVHRDQLALELLFNVSTHVGPRRKALLHDLLRVLCQCLETLFDDLWNFVMNIRVEDLTGDGVDAPVLESSYTVVNLLLHHAYAGGHDLSGFEHLHLGVSLWEAVKDPPIHAAIALLQALINLSHDDIVGDFSGCGEGFGHTLLDHRVLNLLLADKPGRGDTDKAELRSDHLGLGGTAGAGGSDQNDLRWSAGSILTESHSQHSG